MVFPWLGKGEGGIAVIDGSNVVIRNANLGDLARVHEIFNEILLNATATFEEHPYTLDSWHQVFESKRKDELPFFVAEQGSLVIGYGTYGPFRRASGYRVTVEHSLHVDKKYRGLGVGSLLLKYLIDSAKKKELWAMIAGIDSENRVSLSLHQKFGFRESGKLENVAEKFSKPLSLTLMKLDLSAGVDVELKS